MELLARNGRVFARIFFGFEEGVCVADALAADAERLLDRLGIHALAQQVLLELLTHHFPRSAALLTVAPGKANGVLNQ